MSVPKTIADFVLLMEAADPILVEINNPKMKIEGYLLEDHMEDEENREKVVLFSGIPYANPPKELDEQFAPPQSFEYDPRRHGEPFEANKGCKVAPYTNEAGVFSIQLVKPEKEPTKKDNALDCLYLDVYVPKKPKDISEPLAVMVYFHGAGFDHGKANYFQRTPHFMMQQGVILVTVNYRIGPFGFLNMHSEKCRGNAGLKDQHKALEWVRDNVASFGGNPGNVTIWGSGAAATCVNFHLISPRSKGLFHKAIIQSGGIYCPWYTGDQNETKKTYGSFLERGESMIVEKLLETDSLHVLNSDWHKAHTDKKPGSIDVDGGPSVEKEASDDAFVPCDVEHLLKRADPVPILAGIAALDGHTIRQLGVSPFSHDMDWVWDDTHFQDFIKANLHWEEETIEKHFGRLRDDYFGKEKIEIQETSEEEVVSGQVGKGARKAIEGESVSRRHVGKGSTKSKTDEVEESLAKFCTDLWFQRFYDNFNFGGGLKPPTRLFIYKFDVVAKRNPSRGYRDCWLTGSAHGDELKYLLPPVEQIGAPEYVPNRGLDEEKTIKTMCSLWASFSKDGCPKSACHDLEWSPHTEQEPCYLYIGNNDLVQNKIFLNEKGRSTLKTITEEDEVTKALKNVPKKPNPPSSFRTTLEALKRTLSSLPVESTSSTESLSASANGSGKSQPGVSGSGALNVSGQLKGREEPTSLETQVPVAGGIKRHSPSRSPTSESKTSKDESSEAKRGRTDDESDVSAQSKDGDGPTVLTLQVPSMESMKRQSPCGSLSSESKRSKDESSETKRGGKDEESEVLTQSKDGDGFTILTLQVPSIESTKRLSPSRSPISESRASTDESSGTKRGRADDESCGSVQSKDGDGLTVSTSQIPLIESMKRLSPFGSPTSESKTSTDESSETEKGCADDESDVLVQLEGGKELTSSTSQVPSSEAAKRHSPSRSPTSEGKTPKDEFSEAKKGRADDESDVSVQSKDGDGLTVLTSQVPSIESMKRHSPSRSPTSGSQISTDDPLEAKRGRADDESDILVQQKDGDGLTVSTSQVPLIESMKRLSPFGSPTSESKTSTDESPETKKGCADDESDVLLQLEGGEELTSSTSQVPSSEAAKRYSPSRSPTSEDKTPKDEFSEAKRGRADDESDVSVTVQSKDGDGLTVLTSQVPSIESMKRHSPSKSPTFGSQISTDDPLEAKRGRADDESDILVQPKDGDGLTVSTSQVPLIESMKRLSPFGSPTSESKTSTDDESSSTKKGRADDESDVLVQLEGGEELTSSTLQVPSSEAAKRHSPSRSPTSEGKTPKDEFSEAKRGRVDDESDVLVTVQSKYGDGLTVLMSQVPSIESMKRHSPTRSPTSGSQISADDPLEAKRGRADDESDVLVQSKDGDGLNVSTSQIPLIESMKRLSPFGSPTSESKTSTDDESSSTKKERADDEPDVLVQLEGGEGPTSSTSQVPSTEGAKRHSPCKSPTTFESKPSKDELPKTKKAREDDG